MIGRIYCIKSKHTEEVYVGSTTILLSKRKKYHFDDYKKYINGKKHYITAFELLQYEDAYFELIEEIEIETIELLRKKEGEWINKMQCVNKLVAGRTKKEYMKQYQQHKKEERKEYIKQYNENNKEKIKEYMKQYQQNNKKK